MTKWFMIVLGVIGMSMALCVCVARRNSCRIEPPRLERHGLRSSSPRANLEIAEHHIREISSIQDVAKRKKYFEKLGHDVVELDFADTHAGNEPSVMLITYGQYVNSVARTMRDCGEPEIVLDMVLGAGRRIENEKANLKRRFQRWCELVPSASEASTNDPQFVSAPEDRRRLMMQAIEAARRMRVEVMVTNAVHEIACSQYERRKFIERQVIPYYTYGNSNSNQVERLQKKFRDFFGQYPSKRPLTWK